ncbi:MAG: 50S ribosomal protein L18 [Armatimonadetes bacterium]|jgi:large subunit ribosomal protein L18|nr:50S ribosomal protein L18 [Armatimonadota bacterium]
MRIERTPREQRHLRVRKKVQGTSARPRLNVFRSIKHTYAQVIDDEQGITLVAASTLEGLVPKGKAAATVAQAKEVGKMVAQRALEKGIKQVVFDRGGYQYHGLVAALAEGAREGGLEF